MSPTRRVRFRPSAALGRVQRVADHPANRGHGFGAVVHYLSCEVRARVTGKPVVVKLGDRSTVLAYLHHGGSWRAVIGNPPDAPEMRAWRRILRAGRAVCRCRRACRPLQPLGARCGRVRDRRRAEPRRGEPAPRQPRPQRLHRRGDRGRGRRDPGAHGDGGRGPPPPAPRARRLTGRRRPDRRSAGARRRGRRPDGARLEDRRRGGRTTCARRRAPPARRRSRRRGAARMERLLGRAARRGPRPVDPHARRPRLRARPTRTTTASCTRTRVRVRRRRVRGRAAARASPSPPRARETATWRGCCRAADRRGCPRPRTS